LQVLLPILVSTFHLQRTPLWFLSAQGYVQSGRKIVVDVDPEQFFDRVNHDILTDRLRKRIDDAGIIRLIRAYLNSGIMNDVSCWSGTNARRKAGHCRCF